MDKLDFYFERVIFPSLKKNFLILRGITKKEGLLLPHTLPSPGFPPTPPSRFDSEVGVVPERGKVEIIGFANA